MTETIRVEVNGESHERAVEPRTLLVHFLRDELGLTGTHVGCETSLCGACTVLVDGEAVKSCTQLAVQADGASITTIEGLAAGPGGETGETGGETGAGARLHPLQQAFWDEHGLQCGFCTPGMILAAVDFLGKNPDPSEAEVRKSLKGNLCRCTGYHNIVRAIRSAARTMAAGNGAGEAAGGAP